MYFLIIEIIVRPERQSDVEQVFRGPFRAAISKQPGFLSVDLLRPYEDGPYVLVISFANQEFQRQWVATELHAEVWSQMEATFSHYTVRRFSTV